jgi:hypothetical protein
MSERLQDSHFFIHATWRLDYALQRDEFSDDRFSHVLPPCPPPVAAAIEKHSRINDHAPAVFSFVGKA